MEKPLKEIKSQDKTVWITQPKEVTELLKRRETAFNIAKGRLEDSGKIELAMQTAEAFGRGLFSDFLKQKTQDWTIQDWLKNTTEEVLNPLGTGATITEMTDQEAKSLTFRCLLHEETNEPHMASLFTYGFMRGMFLSAFPQGEILMKNTLAEGAPMTEFLFKANAENDDRIERERVKNVFTTSKKL